MSLVLVVPLSARSIEDALNIGPALVRAARAEGAPAFAASLIEGPAVILGLHQRAPRVVDAAACRSAGVRLFRRASSGTAAFAGARTLLFTLALSAPTALFPDTTPRTLLNRHVRPFLKGLTAAGGLSHYFGREHASVRKRPALLLGFDAAPDGAVLIEAIAGLDTSMAVPRDIASADERSLDRFMGHSPAALSEVLPASVTPDNVVRAITDAFAARSPSPVSVRPDLLEGAARVPVSVDPDSADPVPQGAMLLEPARIPIGFLERARLPPGAGGGLWLGGDVLAPRALLDAVSAAAGGAQSTAEALDRYPLEGVSLADLFTASHMPLPPRPAGG